MFYTSKKLDTSSLGRTATIVRNRGNILDHADLETCGLESANCGFTSGTGTLDVYFN
jgi:hypothetical protein